MSVSSFGREIHVLQILFTCIFIRCLTLLILEENFHPFYLFFTFDPKPGSYPGRNFQTRSLWPTCIIGINTSGADVICEHVLS